jgi:hypothetical protein
MAFFSARPMCHSPIKLRALVSLVLNMPTELSFGNVISADCSNISQVFIVSSDPCIMSCVHGSITDTMKLA